MAKDYTILLETNGSISLENIPDKIVKIVDIKLNGYYGYGYNYGYGYGYGYSYSQEYYGENEEKSRLGKIQNLFKGKRS